MSKVNKPVQGVQFTAAEKHTLFQSLEELLDLRATDEADASWVSPREHRMHVNALRTACEQHTAKYAAEAFRGKQFLDEIKEQKIRKLELALSRWQTVACCGTPEELAIKINKMESGLAMAMADVKEVKEFVIKAVNDKA